MRLTVSVPIRPDAVDALRRGRHYVSTGYNVRGKDIVLVSEQLLDACLPSMKEQVLACVGGLLIGTGAVQTATACLFTWPSVRAGVGGILLAFGAWCWKRQRTLRRTRMLFIKSEQARAIR